VALTPECVQAALLLTSEDLDELLQSGSLHAAGAGAHARLICSNSLANENTQEEILFEGERS